MKYESTAKGLASLGRHGDTMLMHVNPSEVATLSKVLGPVTRNPHTGLPEAFGWGSAIGSILGGIGSFGVGAALEPVIGDMVEEGLLGNVLRKAIPALAGAGVGAAVGGATGGKAGAMGGAAQDLCPAVSGPMHPMTYWEVHIRRMPLKSLLNYLSRMKPYQIPHNIKS